MGFIRRCMPSTYSTPHGNVKQLEIAGRSAASFNGR